MNDPGPYQRDEAGIFVPSPGVLHRTEDYDPASFEILRDMQDRHFWYLGRHRFLLYCLKRTVAPPCKRRAPGLQAIDLGGGCGGWIHYLKARAPGLFDKLALGDSSRDALTMSRGILGPGVALYQLDLLNLRWSARWDVAFLLDVLEHISEDREVIRQIHTALRPGGFLFLTAPALKFFWTYNDVFAHHVRRYSRKDLAQLASSCGFEVCLTRYFMFFLSPLLFLSRLRSPNVKCMTREQVGEHLRRTHRVPIWPVNQLLRGVFSLESPLGVWQPFPWGTSILAVLRKAR
jgi:SAM-dependent methyltransferase